MQSAAVLETNYYKPNGIQ